MEPTVFVIDDDEAARESVVALVNQKGLKAEGFSACEEFLAQYDPFRTGCVVADVKMAGMSGLQLLKELKARKSNLPVILITGYGDIPTAVKAMQAGAYTFLEKPCQSDQLWQAIKEALEVEKTLYEQRKQQAEIEARLATLTEDEMWVLERLLQGHPNKRIATDLDIGLRTVELRRANIMRKMQAGSLAELVRMAFRAKLLTNDDAG